MQLAVDEGVTDLSVAGETPHEALHGAVVHGGGTRASVGPHTFLFGVIAVGKEIEGWERVSRL